MENMALGMEKMEWVFVDGKQKQSHQLERKLTGGKVKIVATNHVAIVQVLRRSDGISETRREPIRCLRRIRQNADCNLCKVE